MVTYCSHGLLRYKAKPGHGTTSGRPGPLPSQEPETLKPGTVVLFSPMKPPSGEESALLRDLSFVVAEAVDGPHALLLRKVGGGRALVSRQRCLTRFPEAAVTSPGVAWGATGPGDNDAQLESEPFGLLGLTWALQVSPERAEAEAEVKAPPRAGSAEPPPAVAAGADDGGLAASLQVEANVELLRSILGDAFHERMLRDEASRESLREILAGAGVLPQLATSPLPGPAAASGELDTTLAVGASGGGAAPTAPGSALGAGLCGENNGARGEEAPELRWWWCGGE